MVSLIFASDLRHAIGNQGKLLARLPKDLQFFKNKTLGYPIIMGRRTFESLPKQNPLIGRVNVVVTRDTDGFKHKYKNKHFQVVNSLETAFLKYPISFVIGGADIYKQSLKFSNVQTVYRTKIHHVFPEADAYMHLRHLDDFKLVDEKSIMDRDYRLTFQTFSRFKFDATKKN